MIKLKLLFLFTLLFFWKAEAQIISFTDANFKANLLKSDANNTIAKDLNGNPLKIDSNGDSEISVLEAENVSEIDFVSNKSELGILQNFNLTGIKMFTNLISISSIGDGLFDIDYSGLSKLAVIKHEMCNLQTINIEGCNLLEYIYFPENQLKNLNITNRTNLKYVNVNNNYFEHGIYGVTRIDYLGSPNIENFYIKGNNLIDFDVRVLPNLKILDVSG